MASFPHPAVTRAADLAAWMSKKSHFLLGPHQTGKSHLIRQALPSAKIYALLDSSVYLSLSQNPSRLGEELAANKRLVVIDEIQRLPDLLNEVHRLIESRGVRFLLTGSSARRLRGAAMSCEMISPASMVLPSPTSSARMQPPSGIRRNANTTASI